MGTPDPMNWRVPLLVILGSIILASAASWFLVLRHNRSHEIAETKYSPVDFHDWAHAHLALSPEQESVLLPVETQFDQNRKALRNRIHLAEHNLATAIDEEGNFTGRVKAALGELDLAQQDLRRLTLEHFYEMKEHLNEKQAAQLRQWTHESLLGIQHH